MSFIIFAWIAAVGYGLTTVIGKLASKHAIKNPWLLNYLLTLFVLLFTIPIASLNNISIPSDWNNIFLASCCYSLYFIFITLSYYKLDVSVLSPLYNFRAAFSVLLGFFVLGELLKPIQVLIVGLIIAAGFFVSIDEKFNLSSFFQRGVALALTAMVFLSLTGMFVNKAIAQVGYWNTTFWMYVLIQILLALTIPFFIKDLPKINYKQLGVTAAAALSFVAGDLSANRAYSENLGVSSVIISLPISMLLAFLFSVFAPKLLEKHTLKVYAIRFAAASIMIISALKLSM